MRQDAGEGGGGEREDPSVADGGSSYIKGLQ